MVKDTRAKQTSSSAKSLGLEDRASVVGLLSMLLSNAHTLSQENTQRLELILETLGVSVLDVIEGSPTGQESTQDLLRKQLAVILMKNCGPKLRRSLRLTGRMSTRDSWG